MKLREVLDEGLQYVKFKYDNYKNDPRPRVKVLDFEYPGRPEQKTYGQRKDMLGWNLNYFKNAKYARQAIDDITDFASLLSANKEEMYKRVKAFFPEQAKFIRRYQRNYVKGLKTRKGILWRRSDISDLEKRNHQIYDDT